MILIGILDLRFRALYIDTTPGTMGTCTMLVLLFSLVQHDFVKLVFAGRL
jgi:hypothetical protein